MLRRARDRAVDLGFAAGWGLVKSTPHRLSKRGFAAFADAATVRNGPGAQQLRKNLRRVVGPDCSELQLDQLVGGRLRSYARYWLETFRLPKMDKRAVAESLDANTEGAHHIDEALAARQGRRAGAAAHGQLGRVRRLAGRAVRIVRDRCRAAQARIAVRPLRRVPRRARASRSCR